jgi:hypothetical protein
VNRLRLALALLAMTCVVVGSRTLAIADYTSGSATCTGTSRENWDPLLGAWVPGWIVCSGGCNYAQGECLLRAISGSPTELTKVCTCWDYEASKPLYDFQYVGTVKTAKCGPREVWDRSVLPPTLTSVDCQGPCNPAADCNRDYVYEIPNQARDFTCQCGP